TLKKDTCNTCDSLKVQINNEQNAMKKEELNIRHTEHLSLAENAQTLLKIDLDNAKKNEHLQCLTYDMEKTLPLPRLPTNIIFYKRQLWLYNTGIFSGKDNQGYCYVWLEGEAGRGAQEVGSCLRKHIKNNLNNSIKELVMWSDSCGGQNRNIKIVLLMKTLFNNTELETITLKYLYPGHSFLPNDRNFSDIESALKHQQRLYTPDDYIHIMKTCKKKNPLKVIKMNKEDFVSTENLEKKITNRKVSESGDKINWLATRQIKLYRSKPFSIFMNSTLSVDNFVEVNMEKRCRGRQSTTPFPAEILLTQLWPDGKEINKLKLEDIKSIMHLIPTDAHAFYSNLIGNSVIDEDVGGFNEFLDFEIETN
ncbi:Serine/threonine-protein phosphatase, partial [Aphis craccivora]